MQLHIIFLKICLAVVFKSKPKSIPNVNHFINVLFLIIHFNVHFVGHLVFEMKLISHKYV